MAERSAQVKEEPAQRAGDTEQSALLPRLRTPAKTAPCPDPSRQPPRVWEALQPQCCVLLFLQQAPRMSA